MSRAGDDKLLDVWHFRLPWSKYFPSNIHNQRNRVEWYKENKGTRWRGSEQRHSEPALTPKVQPPATEMPKEVGQRRNVSANATERHQARNAALLLYPTLSIFLSVSLLLHPPNELYRRCDVCCSFGGRLGGRNRGTASRKNLCASHIHTHIASQPSPFPTPDENVWEVFRVTEFWNDKGKGNAAIQEQILKHDTYSI